MRNTATALLDPGAMLATTHALDSGLRVRLRLVRPSDASRLLTFLEELPEDSRAACFLDEQTLDEALAAFTFYDPREQLVFAATAPAEVGEQVVGLAEVVLPPGGRAQVRIMVEEERQRRGIGRVLIEAAAALARRRRATHLKARIREPNPAMEALVERIGPTVKAVGAGDATLVTRL